MSFQQGLSGLNAASKSLEAIGNNVANANTVGFKAGQAQFADVYANSLSGSGSSQAGIGTKVAGVAQQFTQGNISSTNNPLDIAINGSGFFRMSDNGSITYARNGQFELDRSGYIVNTNGSRLTGYAVNAQGVLATGAPTELYINTADLAPKITTKIDALLNLDSRQDKPATEPFNASDPTSYNNATSVSVYDSLGNSHILQTFYVKTDAGTWNVYGANDDVPIGAVAAVPVTSPVGTYTGIAPTAGAIAAGTFSINGYSIEAVAAGTDPVTQGGNLYTAIDNAAIPGLTVTVGAGGVITLASTSEITISMNGAAENTADQIDQRDALLAQTGFNSAIVGSQEITATKLGELRFGTGGTLVNPTPKSIALMVGTGAASPFTVSLDYGGTTQYGSNFSVNALDQDGYASGRLSGFSTSADGTIVGRYTNGKSATLGQVVLASFANPNGLQPLGNNVWSESATSGEALVGAPSSGNLGVLQSSAVEDSNVDLTAELVNMITAQRFYQANAQTIKTQDQVMQTLLNLR